MLRRDELEELEQFMKELPPEEEHAEQQDSRLSMNFQPGLDTVPSSRMLMNADFRGDFRTKEALIASCFSERLYRLFLHANIDGQNAISKKGIWAEPLRSFREACNELHMTGLYRPPKIYKASVVALTLLSVTSDTMVVGKMVGETLKEDNSSYELFMAFFGTLMVVLVAVPVMVLVTVLITIETPFTDDLLGMPGLSYVRSAAETSLSIVKPYASTSSIVQKITRGHMPCLALSGEMTDQILTKFGSRKASERRGGLSGKASESSKPDGHDRRPSHDEDAMVDDD